MRSLYEYALAYQKQNWSIIPILPKDKKPAVAWKEYQTRFATDEEIKNWFESKTSKEVGVGLVTGKLSGVVVVDLDTYKEGSQEVDLDTPCIAKTGGGGKHGFFLYKEGIKNTVNVNGEAIDIRGEGGYVVLPPSLHPSGNQYKWLKDGLPNTHLPKVFFDGWIESGSFSEKLDVKDYMHLEKGNRNDSLYKAALRLIRKTSQEEAWELVSAVNATYSSPLPDREVKTLFQSAAKFIQQQDQKKEHDKTDVSIVSGKPQKWVEIEQKEGAYDWIWEGLIAKGETTLFSAEPKKGKSTLLRHFFRATGRGEEFAGLPTTKSKILVISEESEQNWAENREGWDEEDLNNIYIWPRPLRSRPSNVKMWIDFLSSVADECKKLKIDLLVVDTISNFWPVKQEKEEGQVLDSLVPLFTFTQDLKIAVLLVHHNRKMLGSTIESVRGSNALTGWPAQIIGFKSALGGSKNQRLLESVGRLSSESFSVLLELTSAEEYKTLGDPVVVSKTFKIKKIIETLDEVKTPISVAAFWADWVNVNGNISKRSIQRYFSELHENKVLNKQEELLSTGNNQAKYFLSPNWQEQLLIKYPYVILDK